LFRKKKQQPLRINTVALAPPVKVATPPAAKPAAQKQPPAIAKPAPAPAAKKPPAAVPKPPPAPKKPEVKKQPAIADKTIPAKPAAKAPPQENRAKISDALLKQLQQDIEKIEQNPDKAKDVPKGKMALPTPYALQIDTASEGNYADSLLHHLHGTLKLPEFGEVKLQLTLRQDGTVAKISVLGTQSEANRKYLQQELPKMRFPRFDHELKGKHEHAFVLTFCNE
ncbi:MAG: hypothetical protein V4492_07215, partial [Chlamydiota bacterium]